MLWCNRGIGTLDLKEVAVDVLSHWVRGGAGVHSCVVQLQPADVENILVTANCEILISGSNVIATTSLDGLIPERPFHSWPGVATHCTVQSHRPILNSQPHLRQWVAPCDHCWV